MVIYGSRLVSLIPGWFFKVTGGFYDFSWFQSGFPWFQVGFHGLSRFQVGFSWFQVGFMVIHGSGSVSHGFRSVFMVSGWFL